MAREKILQNPITVHVRLPHRVHDEVIARAQALGKTLSEIVREQLQAWLRKGL